jgi:hypothetical protein
MCNAAAAVGVAHPPAHGHIRTWTLSMVHNSTGPPSPSSAPLHSFVWRCVGARVGKRAAAAASRVAAAAAATPAPPTPLPHPPTDLQSQQALAQTCWAATYCFCLCQGAARGLHMQSAAHACKRPQTSRGSSAQSAMPMGADPCAPSGLEKERELKKMGPELLCRSASAIRNRRLPPRRFNSERPKRNKRATTFKRNLSKLSQPGGHSFSQPPSHAQHASCRSPRLKKSLGLRESTYQSASTSARR